MAFTPDEILEKIMEMDDEAEVVEFPSLKDAIVGYAEPWLGSGHATRLIYSATKIMDILMTKEKMTHTDALDWLDYNVEGGYYGESTPIIMYDDYV